MYVSSSFAVVWLNLIFSTVLFLSQCMTVNKQISLWLMLHCTENPIYVFSEMKLCGIIPNSYIHVSVSDLYIPWIRLPF